jgi:flagellar hook protein FlgE
MADNARHMSVMLAVVGPRLRCRAYLCVLKLGQRLDRIFRRTGKHQFAIDEIALLNRNGYVVMRHPRNWFAATIANDTDRSDAKIMS